MEKYIESWSAWRLACFLLLSHNPPGWVFVIPIKEQTDATAGVREGGDTTSFLLLTVKCE